ncbi:hypothetical protein QQ991_07660 [Weizmannia coagulans]|jgi:hypothetical protein|uniref:Uncharacterized protein n=3 Tax=Heyndrickxia TaxID=2837504 RepID=A0A0C5C5P3_HEYCO|nr:MULTISPECIES: hypothetical protein [Heyndrickxia]NWN94837.1 hypothetical protein [Bacillus sp. (in: firmicutes)]AEO99479.1 hypothetical protein Bcoa_0254 [Heyndrickxia coagulans 36D1]AJO23613.1 hypothetical protein SB48_HM08orf04497 [Heyndrickxia coagulans]AKN54888.1 hypothetical protein AB434_2483 [Heyndrickxia coagulans]ATW83698.1 hypothetical protein CIW84_12215 [Heyndrickxia coagulans]
MAKRKAEFDAAAKNNKTPKENLAETAFSTEFARGEEAVKGANRNSKKGRKGRS